MSGRPVYGLGRDHQRVYAESCEHYNQVEYKGVDHDNSGHRKYLTVYASLSDLERFDAALSKLLNEGYQPLQLTSATTGVDDVILIQPMVKLD